MCNIQVMDLSDTYAQVLGPAMYFTLKAYCKVYMFGCYSWTARKFTPSPSTQTPRIFEGFKLYLYHRLFQINLIC